MRKDEGIGGWQIRNWELGAKALLATIVIIISAMVVGHAYASNHDGNSKLCGFDIRSESGVSASDGSSVMFWFTIISRCYVLQVSDIKEPTKEFTTFLQKTEKELWQSGWLPENILYRYSLTISNDSGDDVDVNLGNWRVARSSYTRMAEGFAFHIPACSRLKLSFYSPWAPEEQIAYINVGLRNEDGKWSTIGVGRSTILVPVWNQYFPIHIGTVLLSTDEITSNACKKILK